MSLVFIIAMLVFGDGGLALGVEVACTTTIVGGLGERG
jgi:hypothetical protein